MKYSFTKISMVSDKGINSVKILTASLFEIFLLDYLYNYMASILSKM